MRSDYHQEKKKKHNFAIFTLKCWEHLNIRHTKEGERKGGFDSVQYGFKAVSSPVKFSFKREAVKQNTFTYREEPGAKGMLGKEQLKGK